MPFSFDKALTKVFGTSNERIIKRLLPIVEQINALEPATQQLSDEQLRAKTIEFRARIAARLEGITDPEEKARWLTVAIKRAQNIALLPFAAEL